MTAVVGGRRAAALGLLLWTATAMVLPGTAAAARAGACTSADGVTVVVDFGRLGGGVQVTCATGLSAASHGDDALAAAGISWSPPTGQAGFVCRLQGRPAVGETVGSGSNPGYAESCATTPPADASWAYWKSSGDGSWSYSSSGLTASRVKPGGFEGWVFGAGDGTPPTYAPVAPVPVVTQPPPVTQAPPVTPPPVVAPPPAPAPTTATPGTATPTRPPTTTSRPPASPSPSPSAGSAPEVPPSTSPPAQAPVPTPATPDATPSAAGPPVSTAPTGPALTSTEDTDVPETLGTTTGVDTVASADQPSPGAATTVLIGVVVIAAVLVGGVLIRRQRVAPDDD